MSIENYIGVIMIVAFFIGIFLAIADIEGFWGALQIVGGALLGTAFIICAIYLAAK